jgi:hypothetical protein
VVSMTDPYGIVRSQTTEFCFLFVLQPESVVTDVTAPPPPPM